MHLQQRIVAGKTAHVPFVERPSGWKPALHVFAYLHLNGVALQGNTGPGMAPVAQFNGIAGKLKQRTFLLGILAGMAFLAVLPGPVRIYCLFAGFCRTKYAARQHGNETKQYVTK
jgi:hypothetical protein